jgi:ParB-like chromosome segregation protein Spo0J
VKIRDRIRELRRVPANLLVPNPKNWRTHPKAQQDALRGVLAEVGMADAVLARELPDGSLMLIDGHLRAETIADAKVPVLVLDVTEAEADKLLATIDPLAAMAETDGAKFDELLRTVNTSSEALQQMLAAQHEDHVRQQLRDIAAAEGGEQSDEQGDPADTGYVQFSVPLTAGQEHDVRSALRLAKKVFATESSGEALALAVAEWRDSRGSQ